MYDVRDVFNAIYQAARQFAVISPAEFSEAGCPVEVTAGRQNLESLLQQHIYLRCHLLGTCRMMPKEPILAMESTRFVDRLCENLQQRTYRDPGWTVVDNRSERLLVAKDGIRVTLESGNIPLIDEVLGRSISIRLPSERRYAVPGFFTYISTYGNVAIPPAWQLYINVDRESAIVAFEALVRALERGRLRFQIKIVNHPARFGRPDSMTSYFAETDLEYAINVTDSVLHDHWLDDPTPGFSSRIGRGRALAPQPTDGHTSFGNQCAGLVASALLEAYGLGLRTDCERARYTRALVRAMWSDRQTDCGGGG